MIVNEFDFLPLRLPPFVDGGGVYSIFYGKDNVARYCFLLALLGEYSSLWLASDSDGIIFIYGELMWFNSIIEDS